MKRALIVVAAAVGLTSLTSYAGRTGEQLAVQERENKRVAQERPHMKDMRNMMERCSAMMDKMDKMMERSN